MRTTKEIGDGGEEIAAQYLEKKGYRILKRNFRTSFGEIDIIALDSDTLVFVEVKKKTSDRFGLPGEMITPQKLRKIKRTAESYLAAKGIEGAECRIDAVLIDGNQIEIVENIAG